MFQKRKRRKSQFISKLVHFRQAPSAASARLTSIAPKTTWPFSTRTGAANRMMEPRFAMPICPPLDWEWLRGFHDIDLSDEEARALVFVREAGAITNADYRSVNTISDVLHASQHLCRLRDRGLLVQKGKGADTYYKPTERLLVPWLERRAGEIQSEMPRKSGESGAKSGESDAKSGGLGPKSGEVQDMPKQLGEDLKRLGAKAPRVAVEDAIVQLCKWRALSAEELAQYLSRTQKYVRDTLLPHLLQTGRVIRTIPDQPNHPQQAYRAVPFQAQSPTPADF